MKKVISAILAGAMCAGAFTACSNKKDDKKSSEESAVSTISEVDNQETDELSTHSESDYVSTTSETDNQETDELSTHSESEYVSIKPFDGNREVFEDGIDEGIEYSMNLAENYEKDNDSKYNPHLFKFSGDEFLIPIWNRNGVIDLYYDGTFSVKNRKIIFSYENWINSDSDYKVNINDEVECDPDIVIGTKSSDDLIEISAEDEWLENVDSDVRDELISMGTITFGELKKNYKDVYKALREYHQDKVGIAEARYRMQQLNETGSYYKLDVPYMNSSDKFTDFSILPFVRFVYYNGQINYNYPNTLYAVDDFLCTDAYGIELDGKYKKGKDFTLKHDLEDAIDNDEQSSLLGANEEKETYLNRLIQIANSQYNCDDVETTIEFSDGEWEWFNADGGLINNGRYDESKAYPGLIMMYVDEDSKNCPNYAITCPLWFYITDDGEIYYPGYVKMD
ncbi:MAG: hypothetical protein IKK91_02925 [Ruminococcus sp.]|nr:hypothetical protein [Ruminococcus sp.]